LERKLKKSEALKTKDIMKRIILLSILLVAFTTPVLIQAQTMVEVEKKVDIEWDATKYDFGDITQNVPAIHTFEFTNNGENPVVILAAKASCGCTVPKYSREPVRPGDKGTIEVKYDARRMGNFSKSVRVSIDGLDRPAILFISGKVVAQSESM
jgi:hypothetical protein